MMRYRLILIGLFALLPLGASAATLSVVPTATSISAGNIVTVRIVTNTSGVAINEAGGTLQFPTDLLDVVSVSKGGSVFTLWVEEPAYSNSAGTVSFDGGIPNPGFTGAGTVLTVTFHAKRAGSASISLRDAAVRANDGLGTDVLTGAGGTTLTIADTAAPAPTPTQPQPTPVTPAPVVATGPNAITNLVSSTHPDQNLWYSDPNPRLSWILPEGATAIQTIVGSTTSVTPSVTYQPAISEKQIKELVDGIAYFNLRAKTARGWGPVSSFKLKIDATPPTLGNPEFSYDLIRRQLVITNIDAKDAASGLAKLELVIDDGEPLIIRPEEIVNGTYRHDFKTAGEPTLLSAAITALPSTGGTHSAALTAYDQANNKTTATGAFVVPVALINQTLFSIGSLPVTLLAFIIFVLLVMLASVAAAGYAWYRLLTAKKSTRTRSARREQVVHRALSMFRTDLERHLKTIEQASADRKLTPEEKRLRDDLTENLTDLERYLKKEFKKFDI